MIEDYTKGIKAFNKDKTCRGFKFEAGNVYESDGKLKLCKNGFHFCPYIACTLEYYPNLNDNMYAEVEALGDVLYEQPTKLKAVTNKIKIIRFLTDKEIKELFYGRYNTGYRNTGDSNTGNWNTGEWNTGDSNTGNSNTGNSNTGNWNTGDSNTGNSNTGNWNTGNWNTGEWNTGDSNTGNSNTGSWNTGNSNTGFFNTNTPETIRVFNSEIYIGDWEKCDKPKFIYFNLDEQLGYKGSFIKSYKKAPLEDKLKVFDIPNFDKKLFFEISGIDVTELEGHLK